MPQNDHLSYQSHHHRPTHCCHIICTVELLIAVFLINGLRHIFLFEITWTEAHKADCEHWQVCPQLQQPRWGERAMPREHSAPNPCIEPAAKGEIPKTADFLLHRDPGDDAGHALGGGWVGPCTWGQRGERWNLGERGVGEARVWSNRAGLGFCSTNIERDFAFTKYKFQLHLTTQGAKAVKQGEGTRPWSPLSCPPVLLPLLLRVVDAERRSWRLWWWWRWWQPWCWWGWGSLRSVEKVEQATHDEALAERKVTSNFGTLSAMD